MSFKNIILSILFVIVLLIFAYVIDSFLAWVLNNLILDFLKWLGHLNIFWVLLILVIGGGVLYIVLLRLLIPASAFIWHALLKIFPVNQFNSVASIIIFTINSIVCITVLWKTFDHFTFLTIIEFIMLCFYIIAFNSLLLLKTQTG